MNTTQNTTHTNGHHKRTFPPRDVARNVRDLKQDIAALLQLQWELFQADIHDCRRRLLWPMWLLTGVVAVMLGCVPIGLGAAAFALVGWGFGVPSALPVAGGMAIIAVAGFFLALGTGAFAWYRLRRAAAPFERSRTELQHNVRWLKSLLTRPPERPS